MEQPRDQTARRSNDRSLRRVKSVTESVAESGGSRRFQAVFSPALS